MVRRGSTVRVRQTALRKGLQIRHCACQGSKRASRAGTRGASGGSHVVRTRRRLSAQESRVSHRLTPSLNERESSCCGFRPYALRNLAVRVTDWDLYVHQRTLLERHARANLENVWNGRPISLIVLAQPLEIFDGTSVSRIELIPPVHQRVYRMGLEHLGVVVGEEFDEFSRVHRAALTGQQFQSAAVDPVYVLFEDFTHVKFYRRSFFDVVEDEGGRYDGLVHVDDWVAQRLVTATGSNPLPR